MQTTAIICNPAAGRGRSARSFPALERFALAHDALFLVTRRAGDEEALAREAIASGCSILVAVGGDGTCARIAAAILGGKKRCAMAVVPTGTGNDFAKSLGVSALPIADIVALVQRAATTQIDIGRANGIPFINSCGFGFDASVLQASNNVTWLSGNAVYLYAALAQLISYRGMRVSVDDRSPSTKLMVTVSNGRFLGGAFRIAPTASVIDGLLDINYIENCGVLERVRIFAGAIRGTHQKLPAVRAEKRGKLTLEFAEPPLMEVDGELRRAAANTVSIECVPRALSVIAAPNAVL